MYNSSKNKVDNILQNDLNNQAGELLDIYSTANKMKLELLNSRKEVAEARSDNIGSKHKLLVDLDREMSNLKELMHEIEINRQHIFNVVDSNEQSDEDDICIRAAEITGRLKMKCNEISTNIINNIEAPIIDFLNDKKLIDINNQFYVLMMDLNFGLNRMKCDIEKVANTETDEPDCQQMVIAECQQVIANLQGIASLIGEEIKKREVPLESKEIENAIESGEFQCDNLAEKINDTLEKMSVVDKHVELFCATPEQRSAIVEGEFQIFKDLYLQRRDQAKEMIVTISGYIKEIDDLPDSEDVKSAVRAEYERMISELEDERDWAESYIDIVKGDIE